MYGVWRVDVLSFIVSVSVAVRCGIWAGHFHSMTIITCWFLFLLQSFYVFFVFFLSLFLLFLISEMMFVRMGYVQFHCWGRRCNDDFYFYCHLCFLACVDACLLSWCSIIWQKSSGSVDYCQIFANYRRYLCVDWMKTERFDGFIYRLGVPFIHSSTDFHSSPFNSDHETLASSQDSSLFRPS